VKNRLLAQANNHLLWLGQHPKPPPEPRFLSRFQWRYKRFRPFTLPVRRLNSTSKASAETFDLMRNLLTKLPPYPAAIMAAYGVAVLPVHNLWDEAWYMLGWGGARGHDRTDGFDYIGGTRSASTASQKNFARPGKKIKAPSKALIAISSNIFYNRMVPVNRKHLQNALPSLWSAAVTTPANISISSTTFRDLSLSSKPWPSAS